MVKINYSVCVHGRNMSLSATVYSLSSDPFKEVKKSGFLFFLKVKTFMYIRRGRRILKR